MGNVVPLRADDMKYTYHLRTRTGERIDNYDAFSSCWEDFRKYEIDTVLVDVFVLEKLVVTLFTEDDMLGWQTSLERRTAWKAMAPRPVTKDHINPSHYQNFFNVSPEVNLQWIEAMQYQPRFRNPESFKAALELTIRGYMDRCGQKDSELQELQKALWYMKFLVAYIKNGNTPIRVADVETLLQDTVYKKT